MLLATATGCPADPVADKPVAASAPPATASQPPPSTPEEPPKVEGPLEFEGVVQTEKAKATLDPGVMEPAFIADGGARGSGNTTFRLKLAGDGVVDGTYSGALGEGIVRGRLAGTRLEADLIPTEPKDADAKDADAKDADAKDADAKDADSKGNPNDKVFRGALHGDRTDAGFAVTVQAADGRARSLRKGEGLLTPKGEAAKDAKPAPTTSASAPPTEKSAAPAASP